jgi:hypothetical protein
MVKEKELTQNTEEEINQSGHHTELPGSSVQITQPKSKHHGFTRTLLFAMFAAMIGTGAQFGYALGVMNAPSEVNITHIIFC